MQTPVLPDSSFYIGCARAGRDPFVVLGAHTDTFEFVTCGMVVVEVCRGRSNPVILQRFRERFAIMPYLATGAAVWEKVMQLAWTLDRRGIVLPAADLIIATCALEAGAAVLTADTHFQQIPGLEVMALPG